MAGFILVLSIILTNSLINKTLQEPQRAKKLTGIPVSGIYPLLKASPEFLARANMRLAQLLLSQITNKQSPAIIGITSIEKSEGKTTLASVCEAELKRLGMTVTREVWNNGNQYAQPTGILLLELPALENMIMVKGILPELTQVFLVCRANRVWHKKDQELISVFSRILTVPLQTILNGVDIDFAEDYIGEVNKPRTGIRSMIKRMVKFEFGNRRKIR